MRKPLAVGIALLLAISCNKEQRVDSSRSGVLRQGVATVRIGYLPHHGYLPLFVAVDDKTFAKHGIAAALQRFETSSPMATALVNGNIDIVPLSTAAGLTIEARDPGLFKVFAVTSETRANYLTAIVVKDDHLKTVLDLKSKRIGIFPGPAAKVLFTEALRKKGLNPEHDVTFVELAPPLQLQALTSHAVDALATYEPIATQAVVRYGAQKLFPAAVESTVLEPTQGGVWLVSSSFLRSQPAVAADAIQAILDAIDITRDRSRTFTSAIVRWTGTDEETARQVPPLHYSKLSELDVQKLQTYADLMTANKVISHRIDVKTLLMPH